MFSLQSEDLKEINCSASSCSFFLLSIQGYRFEDLSSHRGVIRNTKKCTRVHTGFNVCIPDNDPVSLISQFVEEMNLTAVLLFLQAAVIL